MTTPMTTMRAPSPTVRSRTSLRTERQADANFLRTLRDGKGDDAVDANSSENERDSRE